MLKELRIRNFVLIDALDLAFGPGICLLTGETGAGKSILIDALDAATGGRVSLDLIRTGAPKATVEATFAVPASSPELASLLEENGIEPALEGELTLTRELSPRGARCRIDGHQVTQAVLRQAGGFLIDIVSQHEHQALLDPAFHLDLLDRFGGLLRQREAVAGAHARWSELAKEHMALREGARARAQQRDFWAFQLQEIQQAELRDPDEEEALKAERLRLANVEQLRLASGAGYDALYAGETSPSLYDQLGRVLGSITHASDLDPTLGPVAELLAGAQATLREAASALRDHAESLDADPGRLEEVGERLDLLGKLSRKYGPGLDRVIAHAREVEASLAEVEGTGTRLEALGAAIAEAEATLRAAADALSAGRQATAQRLEGAVERHLRELELPNARFRVALGPHRMPPLLRASGQEGCEFLIGMNPGEPPRSLVKTASGGEMARVMLAIKTVLAGLTLTPTLVFDEVDTGISGRAAQAVAEKLAALGLAHQILCITHLPTVAAMADQHLHLEKEVTGERTRVSATELDPQARVRELAQLSSGNLAPAALRHAEELLERAGGFKAGLTTGAGR